MASSLEEALSDLKIKFDDLKSNAQWINLGATVLTVACVAGAAIALLNTVFAGALIAGPILFIANVLGALLCNDIRIISGKITDESFLSTLGDIKDLLSDNPIQNLCARAANQEGITLLAPRRVNWLFETANKYF